MRQEGIEIKIGKDKYDCRSPFTYEVRRKREERREAGRVLGSPRMTRNGTGGGDWRNWRSWRKWMDDELGAQDAAWRRSQLLLDVMIVCGLSVGECVCESRLCLAIGR